MPTPARIGTGEHGRCAKILLMRFFCTILIILGLAVSAYLLFYHFSLITGAAAPGSGICSTVFHADCDAALQSAISSQLGLPLAGWGIVYYGLLLGLMMLGWFAGKSLTDEMTLTALVISLAGAAFSLILLVIMLRDDSFFCPLCAVVHTVNLVLALVYMRLTGLSLRRLIPELSSIAAVFRQKHYDEIERQSVFLGLFSILILAIALYQWVFIQVQLHPNESSDVRYALASFAMSVRWDIPLGDGDPIIGEVDAEHRMVVFTDYQCPGCRRFTDDLIKMVTNSKGHLCAYFKHFPVSKACNPSLQIDLHPRACEAAHAVEAAHRQGMFWEFQDALKTVAVDSSVPSLQKIALQAGLDIDRFNIDRFSENVLRKVEEDIELGTRLGVDETPAVFLNGRRCPDIRGSTLTLCLWSERANKIMKLSASPHDENDDVREDHSSAKDSR